MTFRKTANTTRSPLGNVAMAHARNSKVINSLERISSGVDFVSVCSSKNNNAVEDFYLNMTLVKNAGSIQTQTSSLIFAVKKLNMLIDEITNLTRYLLNSEGDYASSVRSLLDSIAYIYKDPKIIKLFDHTDTFFAEWTLEKLGLDAIIPEKENNKNNIKIALNTLEFIKYVKRRAEASIKNNGSLLLDLIILRENRVASCNPDNALQLCHKIASKVI